MMAFSPTTPTYLTDLITDECPLGCVNRAELYINELTGHRILGKCSRCQLRKAREVIED